MNRIILIGNLGLDPEQKTFSNGGGLVKLRVATTEHWRDRQTQERRTSTDWHDVVVNGPQGDNCMKYLKKGSKVAIEGSMRSRKVPSQDGGPDRTFWEVRAQNVQFLDRRDDHNGSYDEGSRSGGDPGTWGAGNAGGPTGWDAQKGGGNGGGWGGQANGGNGGGWGGQANGGGNGGGWGGQANGGGNGGANGGGWGSSTTSTDAGSSAGWGGNAGGDASGGDGGDDGGQGMPF